MILFLNLSRHQHPRRWASADTFVLGLAAGVALTVLVFAVVSVLCR